MPAIEAVGQAAEQLEKHYALGKSTEVVEMRQCASAAVLAHVHCSALRQKGDRPWAALYQKQSPATLKTWMLRVMTRTPSPFWYKANPFCGNASHTPGVVMYAP